MKYIEKWNIIYYETVLGESPIYEYIESLDKIAKAKVINTFTLLEEFGIRLGPPHTKKVVGTKLWELRILGGDNIRIFYVAITGKTFLLLHGFLKKKQKTDKREIKTAEARFQEYASREK